MIADTPTKEMEMSTENAPQVEMVSDEMVSAYCDAVAEYLGIKPRA